MIESDFVTVALWSYGAAFVGYAAFAARVLLGSRSSPRASLLLAALCATSAWAGLSIASVVWADPLTAMSAAVADALRYAAWFAFLWHLLARPAQGPTDAPLPRRGIALVGALLLSSLFNLSALGEAIGLAGGRANFMLRMALAVFGLILVEQLVRRAPAQLRWGIRPLVVALGGVFGLELFFFADALLFGSLDPYVWVARGFANLLVIPFLAVATARNTAWTVDLHLSRTAVYQSTALLLSGLFLLAAAAAGYYVRYFGGEWGRALQIEVLFAAALLVVIAASSGRLRARLKVFVSKHFFSYRFDYREEWLRFTRTLSEDSSQQSLQQRTIRALADLVESPAGVLWLKDLSRGYVPSARWNMALIDAIEPADGALASYLERTAWIVSIPELRREPGQYEGLTLPRWLDAFPSAWLIVPLLLDARLLGFVVVSTPRVAIGLDWEVRDLLKTASRQAVSYLAQILASEALLEARKFEAFNKMSAFVVHDLKNLVSQLSLMLKNAKRHRDNPNFQADMLATVDHVVSRMNALMLQLRMGAEPADSRRPVELSLLVERVRNEKAASGMTIEVAAEPGIFVQGHEDRFSHVVSHLLQNAIDASAPGGRIAVSVGHEEGFAVLVVADDGPGMSAEFVREHLFKPFQTTKASGMGIGVYESWQYVTALGGSIEFDTAEGRGTRVHVRVPLAEARSAPAQPRLDEAAA